MKRERIFPRTALPMATLACSILVGASLTGGVAPVLIVGAASHRIDLSAAESHAVIIMGTPGVLDVPDQVEPLAAGVSHDGVAGAYRTSMGSTATPGPAPHPSAGSGHQWAAASGLGVLVLLVLYWTDGFGALTARAWAARRTATRRKRRTST